MVSTLFIILGCLYLILVLTLIYGNWHLPEIPSRRLKSYTAVSIVIPFRNEEENLLPLIDSLIKQDYPSAQMEFIFIDDHSVDKGANLIQEQLKTLPYKLIKLHDEEGKKSALRKGIDNASNELIMTTDADCFMKKSWVNTMVNTFNESEADLLIGPVSFDQKKGLWNALVRAEFSALIASNSGAVGVNMPFMANGANLAFNKKLFLGIEKEELKNDLASGDDVFLLHAVKKKWKNKARVIFANSAESMVYTKGPDGVKSFFQQRLRWASKGRHYRDLSSILVSMIILIGNLNVFLGFIAFGFGQVHLSLFMTYFISKWLLDSLLIYSSKNWNTSSPNLIITLLLSFLYPFYIISVALLSLLFKPTWKGRKIN